MARGDVKEAVLKGGLVMQWDGEEVGRRNGSLCLRVEIVNEFAHCTEGGAFFISCLQSKAEGMGSVLDYLREGNF